MYMPCLEESSRCDVPECDFAGAASGERGEVYCEVTVRQNVYAMFGREQQWDFVDVL